MQIATGCGKPQPWAISTKADIPDKAVCSRGTPEVLGKKESLMRMSVFKNTGLLALAVVGIASRSSADTIITVPAGLAPGSQYRLVFVTAELYTAESSNIADYNNAVNNDANTIAALAALGATWLDIGSTATVNAIDNIGVDSGVPIYDLEGNLVANDAGTEAGGMFNGAISVPISTNENGGIEANLVWTGTDAFTGLGYAGYPLGSPSYEGQTVFGWSSADTSHWATFDVEPQTVPYSLYGISGILTVPAVPEPSSLGMAIGGAALMYIARRRYRRKTAPGNRSAPKTAHSENRSESPVGIICQ
jgi:hypothetical protein